MTKTIPNWFTKVKENIEQISEKNIKPKDVRFYNLGGFIDVAKRVEEFSHTCQECNNFKTEVFEISENIDKYINTSTTTRKDFEKKRDKFSNHLVKAHGLVKKNTYAATFAFIGLLIGALLGYLFAKTYAVIHAVENSEFMKISVLIGWALGIVVGRIMGVLKDRQIKKENKYF